MCIYILNYSNGSVRLIFSTPPINTQEKTPLSNEPLSLLSIRIAFVELRQPNRCRLGWTRKRKNHQRSIVVGFLEAASYSLKRDLERDLGWTVTEVLGGSRESAKASSLTAVEQCCCCCWRGVPQWRDIIDSKMALSSLQRIWECATQRETPKQHKKRNTSFVYWFLNRINLFRGFHNRTSCQIV